MTAGQSFPPDDAAGRGVPARRWGRATRNAARHRNGSGPSHGAADRRRQARCRSAGARHRAWSRRWAAKLGARIPMDTERGYHVMLSDPGIDLRIPVLSGDHRFGVTPMAGGIRVAGTAELAGLDAPPNYRRAEMLPSDGRGASARPADEPARKLDGASSLDPGQPSRHRTRTAAPECVLRIRPRTPRPDVGTDPPESSSPISPLAGRRPWTWPLTLRSGFGEASSRSVALWADPVHWFGRWRCFRRRTQASVLWRKHECVHDSGDSPRCYRPGLPRRTDLNSAPRSIPPRASMTPFKGRLRRNETFWGQRRP